MIITELSFLKSNNMYMTLYLECGYLFVTNTMWGHPCPMDTVLVSIHMLQICNICLWIPQKKLIIFIKKFSQKYINSGYNYKYQSGVLHCVRIMTLGLLSLVAEYSPFKYLNFRFLYAARRGHILSSSPSVCLSTLSASHVGPGKPIWVRVGSILDLCMM